MGFVTFVQGRGMVDSDILVVDKAVSEYDERLYFDRNLDTGQWCIYLKTPPSEADLPILGFDEVPNPEAAVKRLWQADTLRHGEKILNDMWKRNEKRLQPLRDKADDASGQAAEVLEWSHRKMGTHPTPRVFVPREV
jgi:hypothetical protein